MPTLVDILGRGYFPRELPPPFTTRAFATCVTDEDIDLPSCFSSNANKKAVCGWHTLARGGDTPRVLGLVNPVPFRRLAAEIVESWPRLSRLASNSTLSQSAPIDGPSDGRALVPSHSLSDLSGPRSKARFGGEFVLTTDVTQFYPSVYSHSVAWAIEGRARARSGSRKILGNRLDALVTACQDRQSVGIPIGPDTSLLLGELVMCGVDRRVRAKFRGVKGFRHVDDYELVFPSRSQAEECLALLRSELGARRLTINSSKTGVEPLPGPFEKPWARELRQWSFRGAAHSTTDLADYFDLAFSLARKHSSDQVIKYALARLRDITLQPTDCEIFQAYLLQAAAGEAGVLPFVLEHVLALQASGEPVLVDTFTEVLNSVIVRAARRRLDSDVAWALWMLLAVQGSVGRAAAIAMNDSSDPVSLLLALWLRDQGRMHRRFKVSRLNSLMVQEELWGEYWLLVYEANIKGWLPNAGGRDPVAADAHFSFLKAQGVEFLDLTTPADAPPYTASSFGEPDDLSELFSLA